MIVDDSPLPFAERAARFGCEGLPVPADLLVFTQAEWQRLAADPTPFQRRLLAEAKWVWPQADATSPSC